MNTTIKINSFSDDGALLKIQRHFSTDESIQHLLNVIKKLQTQKGELISEIDYLKNELSAAEENLEYTIKRYKENARGEQKSKYEWKRKYDELLQTINHNNKQY